MEIEEMNRDLIDGIKEIRCINHHTVQRFLFYAQMRSMPWQLPVHDLLHM